VLFAELTEVIRKWEENSFSPPIFFGLVASGANAEAKIQNSKSERSAATSIAHLHSKKTVKSERSGAQSAPRNCISPRSILTRITHPSPFSNF